MKSGNKYSVEEIQELLRKKGEFTYTYKNWQGELKTTLANMIVFSKWISQNFETKELCVAYEEYDIQGITPISKIESIEK